MVLLFIKKALSPLQHACYTVLDLIGCAVIYYYMVNELLGGELDTVRRKNLRELYIALFLPLITPRFIPFNWIMPVTKKLLHRNSPKCVL